MLLRYVWITLIAIAGNLLSMSNRRKFYPVDSRKSPRFAGLSTFARLPHSKDLTDVDVVFVGIPFDDATTFRPGARFGPKGVRENSLLLRPYNPVLNVKPFDALNVLDYGDVDVVPGYIEDTYAKVEQTFSTFAEHNVIPLACGGDHSITLPILRALSKKHGKLSLVHVDAHHDCWDEYFGHKYNHGTVFKRALEEELIDPRRSIHIGLRGPLFSEQDYENVKRMGFSIATMQEMRESGIDQVIRRVKTIVRPPAYLSFDIDACDPSVAPGTGTPEVGGFLSHEALELIRGFAGINFVGYDVVEVSPPYDHAGITCMLAANILYEFLSLTALTKDKKY